MLLLTALLTCGQFATTSALAGAVAPTAASVAISVLSVTPSSPASTHSESPLRIELSITNLTPRALDNVRIVAERGEPISSPAVLAKAMQDPTSLGTGGLPILATTKAANSAFSLGPGATRAFTFQTTTSIVQGPATGICVCDNQVYPILLSAYGAGEDGADTVLGTAATYLPVFLTAPEKLRIGWIWPIIDPPHRLTNDTTFTDDGLAKSLAAGGRLDSLLSVLELVPDSTPLTVLLDPDTIDGIQVMTGSYRVQSGRTTRKGTEQALASAWLSRLRDTLAAHPNYRVELTPYADPDVQSLTEHGLTWQTSLPSAMAARVATALGPVRTTTDLAWPAAPQISSATLKALARTGVSTVVVNSGNLRGATDSSGQRAGPALARLSSGAVTLDALLIDPQLADAVSRSIALGGSGAAARPTLMSELAVRVTSGAGARQALVLTPPRDVNPSVPDAVATIAATTGSPFTSAISVPDAATRPYLPPTTTALVSPKPGTRTGLPAELIGQIQQVVNAEPAVTSLLSCPPERANTCTSSATLLRSIPVAVQRTESSAWRQDRLTEGVTGQTDAHDLAALMHSLSTGVQIVRPSSGVYTLASDKASLPITVTNTLEFQANVKVEVSALGGLPGFSAADVRSKVVPPGGKLTIELPATVQRSGRIQVRAELTTPSGIVLGTPLVLTVHSTALGLIGVIITVVAGVLLLLALLVRALRAMGRRRRRKAPGTPTAAESAA